MILAIQCLVQLKFTSMQRAIQRSGAWVVEGLGFGVWGCSGLLGLLRYRICWVLVQGLKRSTPKSGGTWLGVATLAGMSTLYALLGVCLIQLLAQSCLM